jgi:acyl dehydratase
MDRQDRGLNAMQYIENKTFDELKVGDSAQLSRTLKTEDIELFAVMSGDVNPAHVDEVFAKSDHFHKVIAHGMWGGALISAVLGTELPGPGTIYLDQSLHFRRPVGLGDTVTVRVTVREKHPHNKRVVLDCLCTNQAGETVIEGEAEVIAPTEKVRRPRALLPEVHLHEHGARFQQLIDAARKLEPLKTAVIHPCDNVSLAGAIEAMRQGLILPVLVGPRHKIETAAKQPSLALKT